MSTKITSTKIRQPKTFTQNKKNRGVSHVISTIIISASLLIILAAAAFVASNLLELQVSNTEFEQAKTNMLQLDEVIQSVALRRGSGGYVPFNQRCGGINIIPTTQTLEILGPGQLTNHTLTLKPNAAGTYQDWTIFGGSPSRWAATSDDNNSTGVQITADTSKKEIENLSNSAQTGTINSVTAYLTAKVTNGGGASETTRILWRTYNTDYESGDITISRTTFTVYSQTRLVNPKTNAAWTWSEINDLQIGSRATALQSGEIMPVSEFWIVVNYVNVQPEVICESSNMVTLVYRGGSQASGADMPLRGDGNLVVNMPTSLSYVRIETGSGVQIKLDYNRVRITETGTLVVGNVLHNFTEITFIRLSQGSTSGSDMVNVKAQNIGINTYIHEYPTNDVTIHVQLGDNPSESHRLYSEAPDVKTVVIFTEIVVRVSMS